MMEKIHPTIHIGNARRIKIAGGDVGISGKKRFVARACSLAISGLARKKSRLRWKILRILLGRVQDDTVTQTIQCSCCFTVKQR